MKRLFKPCLWLMMAFFSLFVTTGCKNKRYQTHIDEHACGITPKLRKITKKFDFVQFGPNNLLLVRSHEVETDESGKNYNPMGCVDMDGNEIAPIRYVFGFFGPEVICVQTREHKYGLLNLKGEEITPFVYDKIDPFYGYYTIVRQGNKYGIMNNIGEIVIPLQYDNVVPFYGTFYHSYGNDIYKFEDVFCLIRGGEKTVANLSRKIGEGGKKHIDSPFDYHIYEKNGKYGLISYLGERIVPQYQNIRDFSGGPYVNFKEGLVAVVKNNRIGFVDKFGNVKIPFKFDYSEYRFNFYSSNLAVFSDGLAAMMKGNKWGYIDKNGNTVIPFEYDWADCFHHGSAVVGKQIKGEVKCGIIDKNNTVILPFEFENGGYAGSIYSDENVFVMCKNGKNGVYSPSGVCLTPCQYDMISYFAGYATVEENGKQGIIDEKGNIVVPCIYESCSFDHSCKLVSVHQNSLSGYVDINNQVVVPIEFQFVYPCYGFEGGAGALFVVGKDGKRGLYDLCGNCTLDY